MSKFSRDDQMSFRGDLDPSYLVRLQTNRCAMIQTTGDEAVFGGAVLALLAMVPQSIRDEIEREKPDYVTEVEDYEYVEDGGWRIGTPDAPVYYNNPGDIDYNPYLKQVKMVKKVERDKDTGEEYEVEVEEVTYGEPVLISPKPVKKEITDYYKLLIKIQQKLEEKGLSWKVDPINEEGGRVDDNEPDYPPTPTDIDGRPLLVKNSVPKAD